MRGLTALHQCWATFLSLSLSFVENEKVRQKLSELVMHERGYEVLQESLKVVPSSASAFGTLPARISSLVNCDLFPPVAFLANVLKDNGGAHILVSSNVS